MNEPEARLAALCAAAGYPAELRAVIAEATFPHHTADEELTASELRQLAEAVKLLAEAGRTAEHIRVLVGEYKTRHPERWRDVLWTRTVRAAARRTASSQPHHASAAERVAALDGRAGTARAQQPQRAQARCT